MLDLTGQVGGNGVEIRWVGGVDVLNGSGKIRCYMLLLVVIGISSKHGIYKHMYPYGPKQRQSTRIV